MLPTAGMVVTDTSTPMSAPLRASVNESMPTIPAGTATTAAMPSGREMKAVSSRAPSS
ncbi:MAG TPA: hypothetical protein VI854_06250 [Acidimicrobiia bacterium]|nr:hypothetical protein [Acidimicrobiia bacterium]